MEECDSVEQKVTEILLLAKYSVRYKEGQDMVNVLKELIKVKRNKHKEYCFNIIWEIIR